MIIGYYEGLHFLDLLSSFENTAWGAQYGAWTQAQEDPLFSSLSNFKTLMSSRV